ncbi:hypothetical protein LKK83_00500, partial [Phormidium sp. CCY1219]|nr:hypothetical protein [Phormidium sp. CCY1219]
HPRDRFSSAREMLDAIAAPAYTPTPATLASPPPVAASQPPTTLSSPSDRPANSSPGMGDWQKATIIGGIIGIFTLLGLWITRPQPEPIISDSSENDTPNSPASPNPPENETPNSPPAPPTPQVPPQPVNPFNKSAYPKTSCGDRLPTDPYTYPVTFYPVFIYNSELNLQRVKAMFCEDAYPRFLENQNQQLIQVASFSTRERAEFFTELLRERFRSAAVGAPRLIEQMPE